MEQGVRGLLGQKLSHSFSKIIHETLCDYTYDLIEIEPEKLDEFMKKREFLAINVTIPYKQAVISYLDFIDDHAREIGAVNTIVNEQGKLYGYNTDFFGLSYMLEREGINLKDKKVLLLGNGGTCKTAVAVAKSQGASEILIASRSGKQGTLTYDEVAKRDDAEVIINTSPVGMFPNNDDVPINLESERFSRLCGVADVIYNPLKTRLLQQADKRGLPTAAGLSMLVAQAKLACEHFLKIKIENEKIEDIIKKITFSQSNIVLIGMPSCGKSRLARELSSKLKLDIVDIDSEIVREQKTDIAEIFKKHGEGHFRKLEKGVIRHFSACHGKIIATGGGVVKNKENIDALKQNGVLIFVDRPLEMLKSGGERPLSASKERVAELYNQRYDLYDEYCDIKISNDGEFDDLVKKVEAAIQKYFSKRKEFLK